MRENNEKSDESLLKGMQEERERLDREAKKDNLKWQELHKPPNYSEKVKKSVQGGEDENMNDLAADSEFTYPPLADETRMALYEIEKKTPTERGAAFAKYIEKAPERDLISQNTKINGDETNIKDIKANQWINVRDDRQQQNE